MSTRGTVWIHSTPSALCPHVEWALGGVLGMPTPMDWAPQPAEPGSYRAELDYAAPAGSAATIASALGRWNRLRFEVAEQPSTGQTGHRYSFTPGLGIFHAETGRDGEVLVSEHRLRAAVESGERGLAARIEGLLGDAWDAELDVFRHAGEGAPVRWLHQVG